MSGPNSLRELVDQASARRFLEITSSEPHSLSEPMPFPFMAVVDERAAVANRMQIQRGILSQADRNLLYIDEVNLLPNENVDAILDAAAQGVYTVRRGPVSATYRARFVLIGSLNPEEGKLRPQILDRFGLRLTIRGLADPAERLEAYRRVRAYLTSPPAMSATYADQTLAAPPAIQAARGL